MPSENLECTYCKGTGKGLAGEVLAATACQVCNGRGKIHVSPPYADCAYCGGVGREINNQRISCPACRGRGVIPLGSKHLKGERCPSCRGTGRMMESGLPCIACRGMGKI